MEPTAFNDIRTIWFATGERPRATTDYQIMLERDFATLADRSISKFPHLWNPDECDKEKAENEDAQEKKRRSFNYLSPMRCNEHVIGHYCVIKPFPAHMHEFLGEICKPYGIIVETRIAKSKINGSFLGIADFKEREDAERAANAINQSDIGDGTILSARYLQKRKRSKALDLIAERQSQSPVATMERKKQPFVQPKLSGAECDLLSDLCQQWSYFSEMNGSISLDALLWNMAASKSPVKTTFHKLEIPVVPLDKDIEKVLCELEQEVEVGPSRRLKW